LKEIGKLALDTNAVIAYRQGISHVCNLVDETEIIYMPVTVLGELLYGALNSRSTSDNEQAIAKFAQSVDVIQIDESIARRYAKVRLTLKNRGHPIPENDIWIAASCLEFDVPIISRDSHFNYVDELRVISWENVQ